MDKGNQDLGHFLGVNNQTTRKIRGLAMLGSFFISPKADIRMLWQKMKSTPSLDHNYILVDSWFLGPTGQDKSILSQVVFQCIRNLQSKNVIYFVCWLPIIGVENVWILSMNFIIPINFQLCHIQSCTLYAPDPDTRSVSF